MIGLLKWAIGALFAPLTTITKQIADTRIALAAEANTERRLILDEKLATLDARKDILLAEQGHWSTRMIRPLFAIPFVIYINKLVLWDKVLGWGVTDPLGSDLTQIMLLIIAAYFVDTAVQRFTKR